MHAAQRIYVVGFNAEQSINLNPFGILIDLRSYQNFYGIHLTSYGIIFHFFCSVSLHSMLKQNIFRAIDWPACVYMFNVNGIIFVDNAANFIELQSKLLTVITTSLRMENE